ncbi:MAG TPA: RsmE family RNA methyltransferase [Alphaproteobacteria bacterium]
MRTDLYKFPRLFVTAPLSVGASLILEGPQAHYLKNVLRKSDGDQVRLFNGQDGEYVGTLNFGKRDATAALTERVRAQKPRSRRVHLLFAPLKKDRLDVLIEKAVELDATDLHPVITDRTEVRDMNETRVAAQIIEAAEQCERLDIPKLHPIGKLEKVIAAWPKAVPIFAGIERSDAPIINAGMVPINDAACLIGPVGGWSDFERDLLNAANGTVVPISLGDNVLRSETAAAVLLSRLTIV